MLCYWLGSLVFVFSLPNFFCFIGLWVGLVFGIDYLVLGIFSIFPRRRCPPNFLLFGWLVGLVVRACHYLSCVFLTTLLSTFSRPKTNRWQMTRMKNTKDKIRIHFWLAIFLPHSTLTLPIPHCQPNKNKEDCMMRNTRVLKWFNPKRLNPLLNILTTILVYESLDISHDCFGNLSIQS